MLKRGYRAFNEFLSVVPKPIILIPLFFISYLQRFARALLPNGGFFIWVPLEIIFGLAPSIMLAGLIRLYLLSKEEEPPTT